MAGYLPSSVQALKAKTVPTVRPKTPVPPKSPAISSAPATTVRYGTTDPTHPTSSTAPTPNLNPPAAPQAPAGSQPYGVGDDPILNQILAMSEKARALAGGNALAALGDAGVTYGDASGLGLDPSKEQAARDNPFSVLANENRAYGQNVTSTEDAINKANGFFSGYRGTKLGELATGHQQNMAANADKFHALVTDINRQKTSDLMGADQADIAGKTDAYNRAQTRNLTYGIDPGAPVPDPSPNPLVSALVPTKAAAKAPQAEPYGGVVSVKKLANGSTLTTYRSGRQVQQAPGKSPYVVKA